MKNHIHVHLVDVIKTTRKNNITSKINFTLTKASMVCYGVTFMNAFTHLPQK